MIPLRRAGRHSSRNRDWGRGGVDRELLTGGTIPTYRGVFARLPQPLDRARCCTVQTLQTRCHGPLYFLSMLLRLLRSTPYSSSMYAVPEPSTAACLLS